MKSDPKEGRESENEYLLNPSPSKELLTTESKEVNKEDEDTKADYEEAIAAAGYGKFHWFLLVVCGGANAGDAIEVLSVSYLLPSAECELQLTSPQKGWLNAVMFIGMMLGGYFGGSICDIFGRKCCLIPCMIINGTFGLLSSMASSFDRFILLRLLSGIGVGGTIPVVWTYFTEFQPKNRRGSMLSFLSSFWMIGNITVAVLGWMIIPSSTHHSNWRVFVALCSIPPLIAAMLLLFFPESPKFLMENGREAEAMKVLQRIFKGNNRNSGNYPINSLKINYSKTGILNTDVPDKSKKFIIRTILIKAMKTPSKILKKSSYLLTNPKMRQSSLSILFIVFSLSFGYYGLWMWLPELFERLETSTKDSNKKQSLCDLPSSSAHRNCQTPVNPKIFIDSLVVAFSNLPGHILTVMFVDKIGRKIFLASGMIFSGFCVIAVWVVTSKKACLLLSCLFGTLSVLSYSGIGVLGVETFPTEIRGTAWGISQILARIGAILGNVLFGLFLDNSCSIPILLVATLLISGGLISLLLPDTMNLPLQ